MSHFYSKYVVIESVIEELHALDLTDEQKHHLASLVDSSLHHAILDAILSELSEADKRIFLQHLSENDHDKIWKFLNSRIENIEDKIKNTSEDLKEELHKDLRAAKEGNL